MQPFYQELLSELRKDSVSRKHVQQVKKDVCMKFKRGKVPTNYEIMIHASKEDRPLLRQKLLGKPVRTISGVVPVAVMGKPIACAHGKCIYCPGGPGSIFGDVPQSYTGKEPASMRAVRNRFDSYLQVFNRLEQYALLGHDFNKVDLIIMGGTFPSFDIAYQDEFVIYAYKAMNDFSKLFFVNGEFDFDKFHEFFELPGEVNDPQRKQKIHEKLLELKGTATLEDVQRENETAIVRCIGLTIETKPDWGLLEHANQMLKLGCTRVELGVQHTDEEITRFTNRGHTIAQTKESIQILKDLGFKLNFHMMPGLPGSSKEKDIAMMKEVISSSDYQPDMMKIYPCLVMPGTPLYELYKRGQYKPIESDAAADIITEFKRDVPEWLRIMRVQRDIPTYRTKAGVNHTNFRQTVHALMVEKGVVCKCIRCKEPMTSDVDFSGMDVKVREYDSSNGKEYFISFENEKTILGFCRMRFPSVSLRPEITTSSALIRELHVYGQALALGDSGDVQHKGIGSRLLKKAEEIAIQNGKTCMVVIAGVGVKEYYRNKHDYYDVGPYVAKVLE
ncbi:MAG: tRNA uridine(34) 5-carboxymethylaminomethyl modification radical SAM/GNAT enzyme Elp3 [Nanoarchaeota archaeon]|nr:tRNA uridine(34) 5-carboxymethylaminomethyl modification radical SAM/GNAT enzyme Elp3 [Nanoarchaeota archaeon]